MKESDSQIRYWANMLNEAMDDKSVGVLDEKDLSTVKGSMSEIIKNQIIGKLEGCHTKQDVYNLVKSTFEQNGLAT